MSENLPLWEKYFDPTHKVPYYFNPDTEESVWEPPKDANIVDKISEEPAVSKDKEISDYLAHQKAIDEL